LNAAGTLTSGSQKPSQSGSKRSSIPEATDNEVSDYLDYTHNVTMVYHLGRLFRIVKSQPQLLSISNKMEK
jgi:hypothetical protein